MVSISFNQIIMNFYDSLIDTGRILTILVQFEDIKKLVMSNYQRAIFNKAKIILDLNNYDKNNVHIDKNKEQFVRLFEKLKSKLKNKKLNPIDYIILNKY